MRAYTWEMLKAISRDKKLSTAEKNYKVKAYLNDYARRYFENSTSQSLKDIDLKKVDWKSLLSDEDFQNALKKARGKKYLNIPIYRPNRYFKPLTSKDGKFNFETLDEAEDVVADFVLESRHSSFAKAFCRGDKEIPCAIDSNMLDYIIQERMSCYIASSSDEQEIDYDKIISEKESIWLTLDRLVYDIQKSFNLPDGWQLFIIACILNPERIGKDLKIFRNVSKSVSIEKVNKKSLYLKIDKGVSESDLALMLEVFQVFLDYDIPTELLPSTTESNILARKLIKNKDLTHNKLAEKIYKDEYLAEDKTTNNYASHVTTNSRITKKIYRAKNRNLEYGNKILSGRKISEILSRYR